MTQKPQPKLDKTNLTAVIVMGRTASGKTTTAEKLSDILEFQNISCAYYKRLVKCDYAQNDSLNEEFRDAGLKLSVNKAIEVLNSGRSVIFDSSFGLKARRRFVIDSLKQYVSNFYFIYCITSDLGETKRRIESRKGKENLSIKYHASDFSVFEHINSTFEEPSIDELIDSFVNSNIFIIDTFVEKIISNHNEINLADSSKIIFEAIIKRFII